MASEQYPDLSRQWEDAARRTMQIRLGRGSFAKGVVATGVVLRLGLPTLAHASAETWIRNEKNWFPYDPAAADLRRRLGLVPAELPSLIEVGGTLHLYDETWKRGVQTGLIVPDGNIIPPVIDARSIVEKNAKDYLRLNPSANTWLGHCRELAIIGGMGSEPTEYFAPELEGFLNPITEQGRLRIMKLGLMQWLHVSDPAVYYTKNKDEIREETGGRLRAGWTVVIDAPEPGWGGRWYRLVVDYGPNSVTATNFGLGYKVIPYDWIKSMETPIHIEHWYGRICETERGAGTLLRIVDDNGTGTNPHRDERWIRHLLTGEEYKPYTGRFLDTELLKRTRNEVVFR